MQLSDCAVCVVECYDCPIAACYLILIDKTLRPLARGDLDSTSYENSSFVILGSLRGCVVRSSGFQHV